MRIARVAIPVLLVAFACDHPTPPEPVAYPPLGPFDTAAPRRLTFSPGEDLAPAWLPDGSGIIYQFQHLDQPDGDRCLAIIPAAGGTQKAEICTSSVASDDSTDAYGEPAVSSAGRLFFTRASGLTRLQNAAPANQSAAVVPLATPSAIQGVRTIPYTVSGHLHYGIAAPRWLGDTAVVYVAQFVAYLTGCFGCDVDTLRTGIELARMDLKAAPGTVTILAGTDSASSVALGGGDTLYYTVDGDSRVFRRTFAGGDIVVWDFGAAGIVRDVQVRGSRLYAVVGGAVRYYHDASLGPVQRDTGGAIHVVDLGLATDTALALGLRNYRRIALSPDGRHLVAEGYDGGIANPHADLWLIDVP